MRRFLSALSLAALLAAGRGAPAAALPRELPRERIRRALEEAWREVAPPGTSLEVRSVPTLGYEGGPAEVEVLFPENPARPGPRAVPVSCRVGARVVSRGLASVLVRAERTVWVARRRLEPGRELAAEDLRAERRTFEREPVRLFAFPPGSRWRTARTVEAGQRLERADVQPIRDVEAGQRILLVARAGRSSVSVAGRARRGGDVGDVILVHNPITGALVRARILDRTTAELVRPAAAGRRRRNR